MDNPITVQQLDALAAQLPPQDQLRLVSQISERLRGVVAEGTEAEDKERAERLAKAEALMRELDAIAESIEGEFDSVRDIREAREERASRL
jgi:hypothetical protein